MRKESKLLWILVLCLIASNVYMFKKLEESPQNNGNTNETVNNVVTEFDTNITELVGQTQDKVVSIITKKGDKTIGSGSGILYKNENGLIKVVTNHHVIDGGTSHIIRLSSGEEIEASLVGSDVYTDLALLETKADLDIEAFDMGDSELTKVGEFVIAIGSPLGIEFESSVTFGIISGKNRVVPVDLNNDGVSDWDMNVLQTDAAINPGNSGGALVNMAGELVGINSLKFSSDQVEGMGFSIPVNEMIPVIKQIEENGKVSYPMVGISAISVQDLSPYQKLQYQLDDSLNKGVYIAEVIKGGAADKAGVLAGDIFVKFNDKEIESFKDFRRDLYKHSIGDSVKITVMRAGQETEVDLVLE